jgi:mono/diheme cytochrome c family protein
MTAPARGKVVVVGGVLGALVAVAGLSVYAYAQRNVPQQYADIQQEFKYGSIGAEARSGIPYWIWLVMPRVFSDLLPDRPGDGYARFGFVYEQPGADRPIGTSYREQPIGMVGLNCAVCHTGTVRDTAGGPEAIILGMPAQQFDLEGYFWFVFAAGNDPRFYADTLIPAIKAADPSFSWFDEQLYRYIVIPRTRDGIKEQAAAMDWTHQRPPFGPGRVDTFNPYKQRFGVNMQRDNTVGTADFPPLFNQRLREHMWLHWDGNNNYVQERNKSAAIGAGANPDSLDLASLQRIADWIMDLPPPAMPQRYIDTSQVALGASIYQAQCAECHAPNGAKVGQVTPLADIGTDPERLNSFTPQMAQLMNTIGAGYPWQFSHFRKTDGYANMPLDGVWLRAPYLHNGSVPTLRDLLLPPSKRPTVFYRGYDVYDYTDVGFVSSGAAAERAGFRYDTRVRGNGNGGHTYGTDLSPSDVNALIEYLKTL